MLIIFLGGMAVLIAMVGGLGLASTMSLNIIERIREIGVMRAIGASSFTIQSQVIIEGMLIGMISWVLGVIFAFPVSMVLGQIVGVAILQSPLTFAIGCGWFHHMAGLDLDHRSRRQRGAGAQRFAPNGARGSSL